jgi:DNA topoisomerase-1
MGAKKKTKKPQSSPNVVIVESPAKARAIGGYLGKDYRVEASVGHVRDLPPKELGVDPANGFAATYKVIRGKRKVLNQIGKAAKDAATVYVATDPDREGEAIAWHIVDELGIPPENIRRALFYEVTPAAVKRAIENPGRIDGRKVDAQQARRILDRLVGYKISPLLTTPFYPGLSAGRVQTVALRLVCEREAAIESFQKVAYWRVKAMLQSPGDQEPESFQADLQRVAGVAVIPRGQPSDEDFRAPALDTEESAARVVERATQNEWKVGTVERKERRRSAPPPFTTSTLQQEASRRLGLSARRTMSLAQRLYEGIEVEGQTAGLITYMRTDSTRVSDAALSEVREFIGQRYGAQFCPDKPKHYKSAASAQGAHEAIRPTSMHAPEAIQATLGKMKDGRDLSRLYELIWLRFVASQMEVARYDRTTFDFVVDEDLQFRASGSVLTFAGFIEAYRQAGKHGEAGDDVLLPSIEDGEVLTALEVVSDGKETQPPARYSEATLVKELEAQGIGRPSTYATIISRLFERNYAERHDRRIRPTVLGRFVLRYLVHHFDDIFEVGFTRGMEEELDKIEEGALAWRDVVEDLWRPLREDIDRVATIAEKAGNGDDSWNDLESPNCPKDDAHGAMGLKWNRFGPFWGCREYPDCRGTQPIPELGPEPPDDPCPVDGGELVIKRGRRGPFVGCANYPDCDFTMNIGDNPEAALATRKRAQAAGEKLNRECPKCGEGELAIKTGRFGAFIGCSNYPKCRHTESLPTGVKCPQCGEGELAERRSGRGRGARRFYGCNRYPDCDYTQNGAPRTVECPECGHGVAEAWRDSDGVTGLRCPKCKSEVPEPAPGTEPVGSTRG